MLDDNTLLPLYILHVLILIHCYKYVAEKKIENSAGAKKLLMTIRCRKHRALQPVVVLPSSSYPTGYSTSIVRSFFSIKNPNSIQQAAVQVLSFFHHVPFWSIWHFCTKCYFYTGCLFTPFSIVPGTTRALWVYFAVNFPLKPLWQWVACKRTVDCVEMSICQEVPIFVYGYFDGVHQSKVLWELERSGVSCERLSCKGWQKSHKITQSRLGGSHSLVNAAIIIIFKTIISPLSSS